MKKFTQKFTKYLTYLAVAALIGAASTYAIGTLTPTGEPGDATHYSLKDIHEKLINFEADPASPEFTVPGEVEATFPTLTEIYALLTSADDDLIAANIRDGITIFGIPGELEEGFDNLANQTFIDNGDGTVYDTSTGLTWQKEGNNGTMNWQAAKDYCEADDTHELPETGWRLPEINELPTIVDYSTSGPAIDTEVFSGTQSADYWSGTAYADSRNAWVVVFNYGNVAHVSKVNSRHVRCVR